jgi:hypothetical protein
MESPVPGGAYAQLCATARRAKTLLGLSVDTNAPLKFFGSLAWWPETEQLSLASLFIPELQYITASVR